MTKKSSSFLARILFLVLAYVLNLYTCSAQILLGPPRTLNYSNRGHFEIGVESDFTSPAFRKLRSSTKTIAIVPIQLSILPSENSTTDFSSLKELAYREAYNARQLLYSFLLVEKTKKKSPIAIQNIAKTDSILHLSGINAENISKYPTHQLARLLGVENVIVVIINRKEKI